MDKPISILILEDSPLDAELSLELLTNAGLGHVHRRVEDRDAFLAAIEHQSPDLILADYSLPFFDGASALAIALEKCPGVPFIFVSGRMGEDLAVDSVKRGATDYILKQRLEKLVPAVKRALAETSERLERRRAEMALRRSEERLRVAMTTAEMGSWELFIPFYELITDEICRANFGLPADEALTFQTFKNMLHPEDREATLQQLAEAIRTRSVYKSTYRVYRPDGSLRWILASGSMLDGTEELAPRMVGVAIDVTSEKRAEEELQKQARELLAFNADLKQFAYAATHDLQEPLRTVTMYTQLLEKRYRGKLDENADLFLNYIGSSTRHMSELIKDLLVYTQVPAEQRNLDQVDMNVLLEQALAYCQATIDETGAVIESDHLPTVAGDAVQLSQVLLNLLANALKYRSEAPPRIRVTVECRPSYFVFSFRDNGIGFDPEHADQIFGLFKRLHTKDQFPGTGLGLAICKRVIEMHGGQIWAESKPGAGANFFFTLPK